MKETSLKDKKIKDLTVTELKHIIQESIADDIQAWRETFEILLDKKLMTQLLKAEEARRKKRELEFIPWEKVKRNL